MPRGILPGQGSNLKASNEKSARTRRAQTLSGQHPWLRPHMPWARGPTPLSLQCLMIIAMPHRAVWG